MINLEFEVAKIIDKLMIYTLKKILANLPKFWAALKIQNKVINFRENFNKFNNFNKSK